MLAKNATYQELRTWAIGRRQCRGVGIELIGWTPLLLCRIVRRRLPQKAAKVLELKHVKSHRIGAALLAGDYNRKQPRYWNQPS